jgi:class 3 adenylate cyclase
MKTLKDCEEEVAQLEGQLEQLRSGTLLSLSGVKYPSTFGQSFTILGLEELVLLIGPRSTIKFINVGMVRLLGAQHRQDVLGTSLAQWDDTPLGKGFLTTLSDCARHSDEAFVVERTISDPPPDWLGKPQRIPNSDLILRFVASPIKDRIQIVVQDVTHIRWLESTFSRYVSPQVIERMQAIPQDELLKTERRKITILFADLRGFTSACQRMKAEDVREMINSYLSNMSECVDCYGGTVDKFVGDQIMALFGAPLHNEEHALKALMAAADMVDQHRKWQVERGNKGQYAPPVGLGIATGEAIIGNVGTYKHMNYTALGHTVNIAARLCGEAEADEILIIKSTHEAARDAARDYSGPHRIPRFMFEYKGNLKLKNIDKPIDIFRVKIGD